MITLQQSKCNGCGICFEVCPFSVLSLDEQDGRINVIQDSNCTDCGACALQCPVQAISVSDQGCGCIRNVTRRKLSRRKEKDIESSPCCSQEKDCH